VGLFGSIDRPRRPESSGAALLVPVTKPPILRYRDDRTPSGGCTSLASGASLNSDMTGRSERGTTKPFHMPVQRGLVKDDQVIQHSLRIVPMTRSTNARSHGRPRSRKAPLISMAATSISELTPQNGVAATKVDAAGIWSKGRASRSSARSILRCDAGHAEVNAAAAVVSQDQK
jgi:hypothetical protein